MPTGHKTPGTIVAEIKMSRMSHNGSFLLLEGSDDVRFWLARKHTDCELVIAENKPNVISSVDRLDSQHFAGALGVVDSDYDALMGVSHGSPNVLAVDAHDLECLLCRSAALGAVLAELGDAAKIRRFEAAAGAEIRYCLLDRALVFGQLRWAALRHGDTSDLQQIRIPRFVDENTWDVDDEGLLDALQIDSAGTADTWAKRIVDLPPADPWHVARGHDMVDILRIGLRKVLGSIGPQVGRKEIARILRQALPTEDFVETGLFGMVRQWEGQNTPYHILRLEGRGVGTVELEETR